MPRSNGQHFPPAPRSVPLSLFFANALGPPIVWLILAFSSIFFWGFCAHADLSVLTFRPPFEETSGTVVTVTKSGAKEDRQEVYKVEYTYAAAGRLRTGTSYSVGTAPEPSERVTIEYLGQTPDKSRIAGMRRDLWSPWILLVALFPGITLLILLYSMREGFKRYSLLCDGVLTTASFTEQRKTNTKINNQRVYEYVYTFTAADGREITASARTHTSGQLSDNQELVLYAPENPERCYVLNGTGSPPEVNENGELVGRPFRAFFAVIAVVVAVCVNVLMFRIRMR